MDPCDGISATFVAKSNTPKSIWDIHDCTGSAYADQAYTITSSTSSQWVTTISAANTCDNQVIDPRCLVAGTKITMYDGTKRNIEDLKVGDTLMSANITGMPDTDNEAELEHWAHPNPTIGADLTQVKTIEPSYLGKAYNINSGSLVCSKSHMHFIKRDALYRVISSDELVEGDFLVDKNYNLVEITSLRYIDGTFQVFKLGVEELDMYIANDFLTHNKE
jgi:hypothetical protein